MSMLVTPTHYGSDLSGGRATRPQRMKLGDQLADVGFIRVDGAAWSVRNWTLQAMQNLQEAWTLYGGDVVDIHNQKKLTNTLARNKAALFRFIENETGESIVDSGEPPKINPDDFQPPIDSNPTAPQPVQAGLNPWLIGGVAVVLVGGAATMALKS